MGVREAAANVLVAAGVAWPVHRLLLSASRKGDPKSCPLASLNDDLVRVLMQRLFTLQAV